MFLVAYWPMQSLLFYFGTYGTSKLQLFSTVIITEVLFSLVPHALVHPQWMKKNVFCRSFWQSPHPIIRLTHCSRSTATSINREDNKCDILTTLLSYNV